MMILTETLSGQPLNWAVALALKLDPSFIETNKQNGIPLIKVNNEPDSYWNPERDWLQFGAIFDKYVCSVDYVDGWVVGVNEDGGGMGLYVTAAGPSKQIATLRALAFAKLGEEVDVPEPLVVSRR